MPFTAGSDNGEGRKTEIMDINSLEWSETTDYPGKIGQAAHTSVSFDDAIVLIGVTIYKFKDGVWTDLGSTNNNRYWHNSITFGEKTIIIGGRDWGSHVSAESIDTEVYTFTDSNTYTRNITCPTLPQNDNVA